MNNCGSKLELLLQPGMDLKRALREQCEKSAHWELLLLQGFWYGLLSWLTTCAEDEKNPSDNNLTAKQLITLTDPRFECWPTEWLEPTIHQVLALDYNLEQLNTLFDEVEAIFQESIPYDLDIFTTLGTGDFISNETWEKLQSSIAFFPPHNTSLTNRMRHKTRRSHGRRALTPLRRRRAVTHHHRESKVIKK
jgi:hypothetical protein